MRHGRQLGDPPRQVRDGLQVNGNFRAFEWPIEGRCLLIPPQEGDYGRPVPAARKKKRTTGGHRSKNASVKGKKRVKRHWIACLFTSEGYGRSKSDQVDILENTRTSMKELLGEISKLAEDAKLKESEETRDGEEDEGEEDDEDQHGAPGELWACKFNSGKFGVDWEKTEKIVREVLGKNGRTLTVVERDGEEVASGESDMDD